MGLRRECTLAPVRPGKGRFLGCLGSLKQRTSLGQGPLKGLLWGQRSKRTFATRVDPMRRSVPTEGGGSYANSGDPSHPRGLAPFPSVAQVSGAEPTSLQPPQLLLGRWRGTIDGSLGQGVGVRTYEAILDGQYVVMNHSSVLLCPWFVTVSDTGHRDRVATEKPGKTLKSLPGFMLCQSGRRDSNPRPSAWKADALAN